MQEELWVLGRGEAVEFLALRLRAFRAGSPTLPIVVLVVPFWDFLLGFSI